ncbi:hypothetical protein QQS21_008170 [Conoideocrella luteorostrata]|uniref:Uncharacterized protein n=1 Tax=Conoideocrella luteorostrata TaxID=1105319 RepID=A0AAJ0CJP1_9HYPO|nr:hypothetical protein QQS21_008170 [Conoideocrella luteorostrata]
MALGLEVVGPDAPPSKLQSNLGQSGVQTKQRGSNGLAERWKYQAKESKVKTSGFAVQYREEDEDATVLFQDVPPAFGAQNCGQGRVWDDDGDKDGMSGQLFGVVLPQLRRQDGRFFGMARIGGWACVEESSADIATMQIWRLSDSWTPEAATGASDWHAQVARGD